MVQSISTFTQQIKTSTQVSNIDVSTHKILKLHSADIPYLQILKFNYLKGCGYTYLKRSQWPTELVKYGGKPIHYTKQKERWAKLRKLGYVRHEYSRGNRNKEYNHHITNIGLTALLEWKNSKTPYKKTGPESLKKRYLETQKTVPRNPKNGTSLNTDNKHNHDHEDEFVSVEEKKEVLGCLMSMGIYKQVAFKLIVKYTDTQLRIAFELTCSKRPSRPGAYFVSILKNRFDGG